MTPVAKAMSELLAVDTLASARLKEWRVPRALIEFLMPPTLCAEGE
jgi:hypothetical protein